MALWDDDPKHIQEESQRSELGIEKNDLKKQAVRLIHTTSNKVSFTFFGACSN